MVIDSSVLLAILFKEAERLEFIESIASDPIRLLSVINALEAALVVESRKGDAGGRELDLLLHRSKIEVVPFHREHAEAARAAWRKYGKGRHPAGLNMGDCCAYALAKISGEPLLFKGEDFKKTDIVAAVR